MRKSTLVLSTIIALLALVLWVPRAEAYSTYSEGQIMHPAGSSRCRTTDTAGCKESYGNCKTCHGNFRATNEDNSRPMLRDPYIANTDDKTWDEIFTSADPGSEPEEEIGLHDIHRHVMLDEDGAPSACDTCHRPGSHSPPVYLSFSATDYLAPISCVGCHGRLEDVGHDSVSAGIGAGLRQHHTNAGVPECKTCHRDADPANYTPVGEDVPPPNYFTPDGVFLNKPTDPCSQHGEEDYAGLRRGLDNDGDGKYDRSDQDCKKKK